MSGGQAGRIREIRAAADQAEDVSAALANVAAIFREMADALEEERAPEVLMELLKCAMGHRQAAEAALAGLVSSVPYASANEEISKQRRQRRN